MPRHPNPPARYRLGIPITAGPEWLSAVGNTHTTFRLVVSNRKLVRTTPVSPARTGSMPPTRRNLPDLGIPGQAQASRHEPTAWKRTGLFIQDGHKPALVPYESRTFANQANSSLISPKSIRPFGAIYSVYSNARPEGVWMIFLVQSIPMTE